MRGRIIFGEGRFDNTEALSVALFGAFMGAWWEDDDLPAEAVMVIEHALLRPSDTVFEEVVGFGRAMHRMLRDPDVRCDTVYVGQAHIDWLEGQGYDLDGLVPPGVFVRPYPEVVIQALSPGRLSALELRSVSYIDDGKPHWQKLNEQHQHRAGRRSDGRRRDRSPK